MEHVKKKLEFLLSSIFNSTLLACDVKYISIYYVHRVNNRKANSKIFLLVE